MLRPLTAATIPHMGPGYGAEPGLRSPRSDGRFAPRTRSTVALRRAANVPRQQFDVGRETQAALKGQRPAVLWFTGLSGAGKSTIANLVE